MKIEGIENRLRREFASSCESREIRAASDDATLVSIVPIPNSPLTKLADEIERLLNVRLPSQINSRGHHLEIDEVSWISMRSNREFCFNLLIKGEKEVPFYTFDPAIMAQFVFQYVEARIEADEVMMRQ